MDIVFSLPREEVSFRVRELLHFWGPKLQCLPKGECILEVCAERVQLRSARDFKSGPVFVDFASPTSEYRRKFGGGKRQMIAKAVGVKKGVRPNVLDATAGLGRDAFVLASLGCRVHMMERSPVMAALLADGLGRAREERGVSAICERLSLEYADTRKGLKDLPFVPDVIYLDPMYPQKKKAALVKKEMRVLKSVVGDDPDAGELLTAALQCAAERVVVKRPAYAGWLTEQRPQQTFATQKHHFDLYLV